MSLPLRLLVTTLPLVVSIVLGWDFLMQGLGQGSFALVQGWFATAMGAVVLAMALWVPLAGIAGSMLLALALRVPARTPPRLRPMSLRNGSLGALAYTATTLATGIAMWQLETPRESQYTHFDRAFGWTTALLVVALLPPSGVLASRLLMRRLAS